MRGVSTLNSERQQLVFWGPETDLGDRIVLPSPLVEGATILRRDNRLIRGILKQPVSRHTWLILQIGLAKLGGMPDTCNEVIISAAEMLDLPGYAEKSRVWEWLNQAGEEMLNMRLDIETLDDELGSVRVRGNIVGHTEYASGRLLVSFHAPMRRFVTGLQGNYTPTRISVLAQAAKTSYSQHLYDYLRSFADFTGQTERTLQVAQLRRIMVLVDEYPNLYDMKRYVLEPAIRIINESTDIEVTYRPSKTQRTVNGFIFTISYKARALGPVASNLVERLCVSGITKTVAMRLATDTAVAHILDALALFEARADKATTPGYLVEAIRNGWRIADDAARQKRQREMCAEIGSSVFRGLEQDDRESIWSLFIGHLTSMSLHTQRRHAMTSPCEPSFAGLDELFYPWFVMSAADMYLLPGSRVRRAARKEKIKEASAKKKAKSAAKSEAQKELSSG